MLKYAFNFVMQNRFVQLAAENETVKKFCFKSGRAPTRHYCIQRKFRPKFKESLNLGRNLVNQNFNFPCKKPAILLSGILSFFGLEKQPEEPELIIKIKKGILFMKRGQFDKAETMFHVALKLAQDQNDEEAITYIYDMLANLAFETGKPAKAEKLFVSVLQRLLAKGEPQDSNKVVHISLKLAKIFQDLKEYRKAEQGFKFCLETLDKKMDEADEDILALWGMTMDWYARFFLQIGRKDEALNCFKKAYDLCVKINGEEHEQTVVLLNDIGTVYSLMGDSDTAMTHFEKARDIGVKLPEMKDLAAIYINLGQLYLLREMYKESKVACEQGMRTAKAFEDDVALSEAQECLENIKKAFRNSNKEKDYKLLVTQGSKKAELAQ